MRDKFIEKIRYRMSHFKIYENWDKFINECRKVFENIENLTNYKNSRRFNKIVNFITSIVNKIKNFRDKFKISNKIINKRINFRIIRQSFKWFLNQFVSHIQNKLKKEKRCFKYNKKNYKLIDDNVFCKKKKLITRQRVETILIELKIDWNVEDYQSNDLESDRFQRFDSFIDDNIHSKN